MTSTAGESPWLAKLPDEAGFSAVESDLDADVAVVGGGIAGIGTALRLSELGIDVVLLEARRIGGGVTGHSSAKLSALHGVAYAEIESSAGVDACLAYASLNRHGLGVIAATVANLGIDCAFRRRTARTYTIDSGRVATLEAEAAAARRAGLPVRTATDSGLPFPVAGCFELDDQAQFDPVAWTRGLASRLSQNGTRLFEGSRAVSLAAGSPHMIRLAHGPSVRCRVAVIASHLPFLDRGLLFARLLPNTSHAIAVRSPEMPRSAMYLSIDQATRSIRVLDDDETGRGEMLFVGGESQSTGRGSSAAAFKELEGFARSRFGADPPEQRWLAHDYMSPDRLPYIGKLLPFEENVFVTTGFSKWGLAASVGAGSMLAERIAGKPGQDDDIFEPSRLNLRQTVPTMLKAVGVTAWEIASDRLRPHRSESEIEPGGGALVRDGHRILAVSRDLDGAPTRLSARCTHLGCIVSWNDAARTWDCPCHGSRFSTTGEVLSGPASSPLSDADANRGA